MHLCQPVFNGGSQIPASNILLNPVVNSVWMCHKIDLWLFDNSPMGREEKSQKIVESEKGPWGFDVVLSLHLICGSKRTTFNHLEPTGAEFQ